MKSFLSLILTLSASAALACPNLAGTYSCPTGGPGSEEVPIQFDQELVGSVLIYTYSRPDFPDSDSMDFIADGVWRGNEEPLIDNNTGAIVGTWRFQEATVCQGTSLRIDSLQSEEKFDLSVSTYLEVHELTPTATGLEFRSRSVSTGYDGSVDEDFDQWTCSRTN